MFRFLIVFLILTRFINAEDFPKIFSSIEKDPELLVSDLIDPYTGSCHRKIEDLRVEGFIPISIERLENDFFHHLELNEYIESKQDERTGEVYYETTIEIGEKRGGKVHFRRNGAEWVIDERYHPNGFTNTSYGFLSSRTNIKNHRLENIKHGYKLKCCDGSERFYKRKRLSYLLREEKLPNGCWYLYSYDSYGRLKDLRSTNPSRTKIFAWVRFHYHGCLVEVEASDGRWVHYQYQKKKDHHLLVEVDSPEHANEKLIYDFNKKTSFCPLVKVHYPSGSWIHFGYDKSKSRCETLEFPEENSYRLSYQKDISSVFDPNNNITHYNYDEEGRILFINKEEYRQGKHQYYAKWTFGYGSGKPQGKYDLISRGRYSNYERTNYERNFIYDDPGNIIEEQLYGNLSGQSSKELFRQKYTYSKDGLVLREEKENGLAVTYEYLSDTPLVSKKCLWDREKLIKRECFSYDEDRILILRTEDDGDQGIYKKIVRISPKKEMPACGLPEQIDECAGNKLLKRVRIHYDNHGYVCKKEIFDASGEFCYDIHFKRDHKGHLIEEKDPLGRVKAYTYDADGLKIYETSFGGKKKTHFVYDSNGRLISEIEETTDGLRHKTSYFYNSAGHLVCRIDPLKNETHFERDCHGNPLVTRFPDGSWITRTFDPWGNELSQCDAEGQQTIIDYNARNKPTHIIYPDGSTESMIYNRDGTLTELIDREGNKQRFEYDIQGRLLSHSFFDARATLLKQELYQYDNFYLRKHIDAAGNVTEFFYDEIGRKIKETGIQEITYSYDALGRLEKKTCGETITLYLYDALDRIVEQKEETLNGELIAHRKTIYDEEGLIKEKWAYNHGWKIVQSCKYDGLGRLIQSTDGCNRITNIQYDESSSLLKVIKTAPNGLETIETKDRMGRTLSLEQIGFSRTDYIYNSKGLPIEEKRLRFSPHGNETIITRKTYDNMGRLLCLVEAADTPKERKTSYCYNKGGRLVKIIKPDNIAIIMEYDALGRCIRKSSSDQSIDYLYHYNALDEVICIEDHILGQQAFRTFDQWGRLLQDRLGSGLTLNFSYDLLGRRTAIIYPDGSSTSYSYARSSLHSISRKDYTHTYNTYDEEKRVISQDLPFHLGREDLSYDPMGKLIERSSRFGFQKILNEDSSGNILELAHDNSTKVYSYDSFDHLIQEPGHIYAYDSLHNRYKKDDQTSAIDELGQLTSECYYDPNGNPISIGDLRLSYDALGRLTFIEKKDTFLIEYVYDAWHRRLCSFIKTKEGEERRYYLWDHDCEIGSCNSEGSIEELRILGWGGLSEKNATIAIELKNKVYIPLHDLFGNIHYLIDSCGKYVESYSFTAFGEDLLKTRTGNPWRYAAKRHDSQTGFIYFGKRYYLPFQGRFLTPDPRGYSTGPNLYAFAHNNPLRFYDAFGEYEKENVFENLACSKDIGGWEGSPLESLTFALHEGIHAVGSCITAIGLHLIPDFLGGSFLRTAGDSLQNTCEPAMWKYYPDLKDAKVLGDWHSKVFSVGDAHASDIVRLTFSNGMLNRRAAINRCAQELSKLHNNAIIYVCYNATHGIFADLCDSILEKRNIRTHPVDQLTKTWQKCFAEMGQAGKVIHYAHSEGGLITKCALMSLTKEERRMIEVYTFGSASLFNQELTKFVHHYVATGDPIPMTDPISYTKALFNNDGSVEFLGTPLSTFMDHSFMGGTYWEVISRLAEDFNTKYGCPP